MIDLLLCENVIRKIYKTIILTQKTGGINHVVIIVITVHILQLRKWNLRDVRQFAKGIKQII